MCVTHTPVMCAYVYFIHVYLHRQTDKQSGNQTASQTGGTGDWGCPGLWVCGVRRLCCLLSVSVSHVMNNCNLYFILLVYYSLSMARFTWLGYEVCQCEGSIESKSRERERGKLMYALPQLG